jgi:hypothetical protein
MIDDIEILRCANFLLKEYGTEEALYRAGLRADACLESGDVEGQRTWLRIVAIIKELTRETRSSADLIH